MIRPASFAPAARPTAEYAPLLVLFAALLFYLWMFFASESLEETAAAGRFLSTDGVNAPALAERYSYEWRHGMAGGWPLYVPGFFVVAAATVIWSRGRPMRRVALGAGIAVILALLAAKLLAPLGTRWLMPSFERDTGLVLSGSSLPADWTAALPAIVNLMSWFALVVAVQGVAARRVIWPLLASLTWYMALAAIRPGDFMDLARPWGQAVLRGEVVAIVSTILIPLVAAVLWRYSLPGSGASRVASAAEESPGAPSI